MTGCYARPKEFHRQLVLLLEQHADLTIRASPAGQLLPPAVQSFHVPPLVIQHIERALLREVSADPAAAPALADELWNDAHLEVRQIAAGLLGMLPADMQDEGLRRIAAWAKPETDRQILGEVFNRGTVNIRRQAPLRWLETINLWISSSDPAYRRMGIMALQPLIEDRSFENLPAVFKAVSPLIQEYQDLYRSELRRTLIALSRRSPNETAYFLRQMISINSSPELIKLLRQCLPDFPEEVRSRLRTFLQALQR